jgi:hypothetical protein
MHKERNMKLTNKSGAKMAMTAAVLLVSGATIIGAAMAETVKGRCFGVNGCKGQGNCKSAKNDCKGQGWLEMLQNDCADKQGQWEAI